MDITLSEDVYMTAWTEWNDKSDILARTKQVIVDNFTASQLADVTSLLSIGAGVLLLWYN